MLKQLKSSPKIEELKKSYPNANNFVVFFAIIMVWRGVWGLLDLYFFPGSPTFSHLVTLVLGVVVLYVNGFSIENLKR